MLRAGEEPILGYRLDKFLGRGQFGDVWQAQAPGGKLVALKFINIIGKQGLKEYKAIQKVKNIQHPHLMPIIAFWILDQEQNVLNDEVLQQLDLASQGKQIDVRRTELGEEPIPNTLVVAMLLGEASLYDHFEKCREEGKPGIPVAELLDYMEEAAKGIDFLNRPCHDLGDGPVAIQHCDIKPQNMLLTGGAVQICDFGLARVLDDVRQTRSVAGTPAYIAPESISGRRPSATTDQYSLAITYYEMRTGDLPFASDDRTSQMAIMQAHMKGRLEFVLSPPAEAEVLRKATSVEPESRFRTSIEMVRALRRAVEQPQQVAAQIAGTMASDDHSARTMSQPGDSSVFNETEVVDRPAGATSTLNAKGIDGTLVTHGEAIRSDPTPAAPAAKSRPKAGGFLGKQQTKSAVPAAAIALVTLALCGAGGFFWWNSTRSTGTDPVSGGGNGGGSAVMKVLQFEPADAIVKINGKLATLTNGALEIARPESNELFVEASHTSGEWQLAKTFSWSQLEALGFKIELPRTAQSYVAKAWRELDGAGFDQAVEDFRKALQLNRGLAITPPPQWFVAHGPYINRITVDAAGQWLASVSDGSENNAFAWRLQPSQPYAHPTPLPGQKDLLEAIRFSPDGKWLATGGAGGRVQLWQVGQFEKGAVTLAGVDQDVLALDFDSQSKYLAASSYGNTVAVWQLDRLAEEVEPHFTLQGHVESVKALAFVPGTFQLVTGSWDDTVKLWKLPAPGEPVTGAIVPIEYAIPITTKTNDKGEIIEVSKGDVNVVAVDPQGNWLIAGTAESAVLWDLAKPDEPIELIKRGISVEAVVFSPDSRYLAAADAEGHIYLCALEPGKPPEAISPLEGHKGAVVALAFSPDNRWLASGGDDKRILLWDLAAAPYKPVSLVGHASKIRSLNFTASHDWLVSGDDDGKIGLWHYRRWAVIDRALRSLESTPTIEARRPGALPAEQLLGQTY